MVALPGNAYDFKVIWSNNNTYPCPVTTTIVFHTASEESCNVGQLLAGDSICHLLKSLQPESRFLIARNCAWLPNRSLLKLLIAWFSQWFKGQIGNHTFLVLLIFAVTLLALKKDHLIPFWSWSKILNQGTYTPWIDNQCWDSDPLAHLHHV